MSNVRFDILDFHAKAKELEKQASYYEELATHFIHVAPILKKELHQDISKRLIIETIAREFAENKEKPFYYFKKASDYIVNLRTAKFATKEFISQMKEAFDIKPTEKNRIIVIDNSEWEPLDFTEAMNFVFPRVVALQAEIYKKALIAPVLSPADNKFSFSSTAIVKASLENDFANFSAHVENLLASYENVYPFSFINSIKEYQDSKLREQLFNKVIHKLWENGAISFPGADELLRSIAKLFAEGELYEQYTRPISLLYQKHQTDIFISLFFPGLFVLFAKSKQVSPQSLLKTKPTSKSPPPSPSLLSSIREDYIVPTSLSLTQFK